LKADFQSGRLLEAWLKDHVGFEFFKSGFARSVELLTPYKTQFQNSKLKIITIGGTNGKGQTCFELNALLQNAGARTALWTSPHIRSVSERFVFLGEKLHEATLLNLFKEQWAKDNSREMSYYEFLMVCFCEQVLRTPNLDYLILEVGMGGRLDAVNVFDADFAAITSISLDHTAVLGDHPLAILKEKWGITRPHRPLVTALSSLELRQALASWSEASEVPWLDLWQEGLLSENDDFRRCNQLTAALLFLWLQKGFENFSLKQSSNDLSILLAIMEKGQLQTPGRFEEMTLGSNRFIFIGSHNEDGLRKMVEYFQAGAGSTEKIDEVWLSLSTRPLPEAKAALEVLLAGISLSPVWSFCLFNHAKAMSASELSQPPLAGLVKQLTGSESPFDLASLIKGLESKGAAPRTLLVTGSYYFISEVQKSLFAL